MCIHAGAMILSEDFFIALPGNFPNTVSPFRS